MFLFTQTYVFWPPSKQAWIHSSHSAWSLLWTWPGPCLHCWLLYLWARCIHTRISVAGKSPVDLPKKYFTLSLWTQMQLQFMKNKNKYLFTWGSCPGIRLNSVFQLSVCVELLYFIWIWFGFSLLNILFRKKTCLQHAIWRRQLRLSVNLHKLIVNSLIRN